MIIATVI